MANPRSRETLSHHISGKEARAAGFPSGTEASGYFMPNGRLLTHYDGQVFLESEGQGPIMRKVIVLTDGQQWFVGAQAESDDTHVLLESLHRGIQNGQRERHMVNGEDIRILLQDPARLPEVELPSSKRAPVKINTQSHSFE